MTSDEQGWPPRLAREARLRCIEEALARPPEAQPPDMVARKVERAGLFYSLGRTEEARQAYLDVLMQAPTDFAALNDFGALLTATGFRTAARTVYEQAVRYHPDNPKGHVNLANLLRHDGDLTAAQVHYEAALECEPSHPQAHQGLGAVLAVLGDADGAARHRFLGYRSHAVTTLRYRGIKAPLPLLVLASASGGDIPTATLLDDRVFLLSVVVTDFCDASVSLPQHRVVFNAIGDADLCAEALRGARTLLERTSAPVINSPDAVMRTGRAANARRLALLPGVVSPRMIELPRQAFAAPETESLLADHGLVFPLLIRTPGCHTGQNFLRVETGGELAAASARLPGERLLAIEYLDARRADGSVRKYRVMIIDGTFYPLHVAVSRSWKVHYFTADMDNRENREEDAAFLANMAQTLGPAVIAALERIGNALGLDYCGIDFGIDAGGRVLLFEANATMAVYPPDADERWSYRRQPVARILDAVRAMIVNRVVLPRSEFAKMSETGRLRAQTR